MFQPTTGMTQLFIDEAEAINLRRELEDAFCRLDDETDGHFYSLKRVRRKVPRLVELFSRLGKPGTE